MQFPPHNFHQIFPAGHAYTHNSRVDTDVLMEVAYSCNFLAVSDSSTCPDIGTSWCHAGIIEHFEIRGFKMTPYGYNST